MPKDALLEIEREASPPSFRGSKQHTEWISQIRPFALVFRVMTYLPARSLCMLRVVNSAFRDDVGKRAEPLYTALLQHDFKISVPNSKCLSALSRYRMATNFDCTGKWRCSTSRGVSFEMDIRHDRAPQKNGRERLNAEGKQQPPTPRAQ